MAPVIEYGGVVKIVKGNVGINLARPGVDQIGVEFDDSSENRSAIDDLRAARNGLSKPSDLVVTPDSEGTVFLTASGTDLKKGINKLQVDPNHVAFELKK